MENSSSFFLTPRMRSPSRVTSVTGYTITATGAAGKVTGHVYTINENNQQQTTQFNGQAMTGKNCWLARGNEC